MLNEQLERLQTDYIDFYLMHALDKDRFKNVVEKFNLIDKLNKAKADGKIRHIGFSFHDDVETLKKIIDANPNWEFCQIQLNYINVKYQAGLEGLEYAHKKGLDVVIMEPLLGGKLANPSPQVAKMLFDEKTPVEWAMDFLWNRAEVSLLLRGMGAMEQVQSKMCIRDRPSTMQRYIFLISRLRIFSLIIRSAAAFFAPIIIPDVFLSRRLQNDGEKLCSFSGLYSPFL